MSPVFMNAWLSDLNVWKGERYEECGRILILLESTYGASDAKQRTDVLAWAEGGKDATFEKLYQACARDEEKIEFFNRFACMNLAIETVAQTNRRAPERLLREGAAALPDRLRLLKPRVVWIASRRAQPYALTLVMTQGANAVLSAHPSRASNADLRKAWENASFRV